MLVPSRSSLVFNLHLLCHHFFCAAVLWLRRVLSAAALSGCRLSAMPCPLPNCYYCNLMAASVAIADRCPDCLDDWICDSCALLYELTDVEADAAAWEELQDSPSSSSLISEDGTRVPPSDDDMASTGQGTGSSATSPSEASDVGQI